MTVPIPCKACLLGRIPFSAREGSHSITCPRCGETTRVVVSFRRGKWLVRTILPQEAV